MSVQEFPVAASDRATGKERWPHIRHVVQFYDDERSLLEELSHFIGRALVGGGAAIVIATEAHRAGLARKLKAEDIDLDLALADGRYVSLDAAETASRFLVNGMPEAKRFDELVGGIVARANAAAKTRSLTTAIFGEMVALLWKGGNHLAAIRLEELWNELAVKYPFSLRCAYPMSDFKTDERGELFTAICERHSAVIPEHELELHFGEDQGRRAIARLQQQVHVLQHRESLRESEEKFRLLVEAVQDYAIFMLDAGGRVRSWNIGAERIKGYKPAEIIGKHFSCFYPEADVLAGKPERELQIARREGRVEDEGWRLRKDGSRFWANVVITALRDNAGDIVGFAKVTRDQTEKRRAQQALEESQQRLQSSEDSLRGLSVRLLRTQDEERRRIARDLHDSLGQYLSVLKMKLDSLGSAQLAGTNGHAQELAQCAELTADAIKEVRTISYLLYPPLLEELGLRSAIPWYLEGFAKRSGIQTSFTISPDFGRLEGDVELVVFRVLQESLTNVHRHSGSATADVQLLIEGRDVILKVSDRGKGLPPGSLEESGRDWTGALGVGLRGMSERVREAGGRLDFSSTAEGTTVSAIVPIARNGRPEAAARTGNEGLHSDRG
jgi:PAS domain S-box-containing protein